MKSLLNKQTLIIIIVLLVGIIAGKFIFGESTPTHATESEHNEAPAKEVWTCSMHPQIKQNHAGKCPICGMDLIPLQSGTHAHDSSLVHLSDEAAALANIQTWVVGAPHAENTLRLYGTIKTDETQTHSLTAHYNGRIERLFINYTGQRVNKGQVVARIYSPDLFAAQQELLEAVKMKDLQPGLFEAAQTKLKYWNLTDGQIRQILQTGHPQPTMDLLATVAGTVVERNIQQGDYVNAGQVLFTISNLSRLWAMFDVYESDLPSIKVGNQLQFTVSGMEDRPITGRIAFIDPVINPQSRTAKARVELMNSDGRLKPEMFATAELKVSHSTADNGLMLPKSAILWTGKRSVIYVKMPHTDQPSYQMREVTLGGGMGDYYRIESGVREGDEVVVNGAFTIDATAQLEGKPNMMRDEIQSNHSEMKMDMSHMNMEKKEVPTTKEGKLMVHGVCESCKTRIESTVKRLPGVEFAEWSETTHQLHLKYHPDRVSIRQISKAVAKVGHDTELDKAPDDVYNSLPACCLYRE